MDNVTEVIVQLGAQVAALRHALQQSHARIAELEKEAAAAAKPAKAAAKSE